MPSTPPPFPDPEFERRVQRLLWVGTALAVLWVIALLALVIFVADRLCKIVA